VFRCVAIVRPPRCRDGHRLLCHFKPMLENENRYPTASVTPRGTVCLITKTVCQRTEPVFSLLLLLRSLRGWLVRATLMADYAQDEWSLRAINVCGRIDYSRRFCDDTMRVRRAGGGTVNNFTNNHAPHKYKACRCVRKPDLRRLRRYGCTSRCVLFNSNRKIVVPSSITSRRCSTVKSISYRSWINGWFWEPL
jgi:hypothetical protein